ncbi:Kelch repeat type 1 [Lasiodiplodia theobromae]|uniref:Kelch domain-containing protein n=1 Tax=Lasiodiplodia theobromae TaxID=45133 RepID=UPI0015C2E3CC|nr:Kelch domain-containing protein [Lasiodiplodia theobromae]KAF4535649.1 Kelch domain-containing protein [Lasiodiplodia theobromae]KAF9638934.1 Kelch repeat type 1 [Lasiodiplodia theobromae]
MAEIAAGAVVAEQVVSTTIEGGAVAGYAIAKKTLPLKATFTRIAVSDLIRRHSHTVSVVKGKAYIFGGFTPDGTLAGNEFHQLTLSSKEKTDYKCIPALPEDDASSVPPPRAGHSASVFGKNIIIYGGLDEAGNSVEDGSKLWSFNTDTLKWTLRTSQGPKDCQFYHGSIVHGNNLLLYGGYSRPAGTNDLRSLPSLSSVDVTTGVWQAYEDQALSPVGTPAGLAFSQDKVFTVGIDSKFQAPVHYYDLQAATTDARWDTIPVPSNPLVPGPDTSRDGAGVITISTGQGRKYLLYLFGQKHGDGQPTSFPPKSQELFSDAWTFQLPSTNTSLASAKDAARLKLGMDSGEDSWAEVELKLHKEEFAHEGKVHPGPRSFFAASNFDDKSVILWGGLNPKQEVEGDGWIIKME